jgi:hypothetical protein
VKYDGSVPNVGAPKAVCPACVAVTVHDVGCPAKKLTIEEARKLWLRTLKDIPSEDWPEDWKVFLP